MFLLTALFFLPFSLAAADSLDERDSSCSSVHLFLARGNGEPYPGRVGALANTVCNGLSSCDYENIMFDSTEAYCQQVYDGATGGAQQIAAYASRCPNSKLVLGGYSLGAHIVGDILGGGGGPFYTCTEGNVGNMNAGSSPATHIDAALLFGDVRHTANQPYNVGPGSGSDGQYPRSGSVLANLNQFSGKLRSYCLSTDPICALGNDGLSHTTYMDVYASDAGAWVQQMLGFTVTTSVDSFSPPSSSSPSPSPTPTPTQSSSNNNGGSQQASVSTPPTTSVSVSPSSSTSSTSSAPQSTTFTPFVFSDTPSSSTSISSPTVSSASISSTTMSTSSSKPHSTTVTTSSSKAGAYFNSAQLTMNLVTLVVIKVLAF